MKDKNIYIGLLILLIFSLIHILHPEGILVSLKKNRKFLEKSSPDEHKLSMIIIKVFGILALFVFILLFIQFGL